MEHSMTFENISRILFGGLGIILCLTLPIQAAIELAGWINEAKWSNYDLIWCLGEDVASGYYNTDMKGLNFIIHWLMDIWVSVPIALLGLSLFNVAMAE
jgi:hypothetical protein